ncbi:4'-phosphopantetheinyl transferase [Basidiobolus meristosporus CBS 931.73]|uniref:4'-phosphopantetheinyl transferase n=1 Tax=Basidiobolus meristosporus CBS 931.73 TaxID=1314790 RepID=A0A1Y1XX52_9FUNG|nr:4'-phosphopantetheinyl transferase [Basidiobolus meristosporus CBS 931.73]|eukprot:ORX90328.1 4'-phosphopantetheinyl transferase [Basidiobolus meristosporus CBS 931.73]
MILGIGVDLVHLPRIQQLLTKNPYACLSFARRVLSPAEFTEFQELSPQEGEDQYRVDNEVVKYLGTRFAIKEAAYKALFPREKLTWNEVTVYKVDGKPYLNILDAESRGIKESHVSVSHDGEYAIAQVLLEGK